MSYTATIAPIDWNEFMAMLQSLPIPPSEEDKQRVFDTISDIKGQEDIFSTGVAWEIIEDLKTIKFSPEHRRELKNIFAMLFTWHFEDNDVDWGRRYYDFSKLNLKMTATLCSPQDVRTIYQKLTEFSPLLEQYALKGHLEVQESRSVSTFRDVIRKVLGKSPRPVSNQHELEAQKTKPLVPYEGKTIFTYLDVIMDLCEEYSREGKGVLTYWG